MFVHAWGSDRSAPVFFLHGRGGTGLAVNEIARGLAPRRVVSVDLPGTGRTPINDSSDLHLDVLLGRLHHVLRSEFGMTPATLAGHSWGASLACHLAARYPAMVGRLVLLDGGHLAPSDDPEHDSESSVRMVTRFYEGFRFPTWRAYLAVERKHVRRWNPFIARAFRSTMRWNGSEVVPRLTPDAIRACETHLVEHPVIQTYKAIDKAGLAVLLITAGAREGATGDGADRLCAAISGARHVSLTRSGHDVPVDAAPDIVRLLGDGS